MKFSSESEAIQKLELGRKICIDKVEGYSPQTITICEKGFVLIEPKVFKFLIFGFTRRNTNTVTAFRYDNIISYRMRCLSYSTTILGAKSWGFTTRYKYFLTDGKDFESDSRKLMEYIANSIQYRLQEKITSDIATGQEVKFGSYYLSSNHIRVSNICYPLSQIESLGLFIGSESEGSLVGRIESVESKSSNILMSILKILGIHEYFSGKSFSIDFENLDNPHLFFKQLKALNIPLDFGILPEISDCRFLD